MFPPGRCSNGEAYPNVLAITVRRGAAISADGETSYYDSNPRAFFVSRRGKRVHGRDTLAISARFVGDQVSGTVSDEFRSRRIRCLNGPASFTAFRDGTAGAPLRDAVMATGHYVGRATEIGHASQPFTADVSLPLGVFRVFKFGWVLPCGARMLREHATFNFLPLSYLYPASPLPDGTFDVRAHGVDKLPHRVVARWWSTLHGGFWPLNRPRYGITGTWTYNVDFTYKGRYTGFCGASVDLNAAGPPR